MIIYFVGLHNKAGKMPLGSSTKSGKLIDRVINGLPTNIDIAKTNLFNVDYFPVNENIENYKLMWLEEHEVHKDDIIVLLGAYVHKNFPNCVCKNIIKLPHPAAVFSKYNMERYVKYSLRKIGEVLIKL